MRPLLLIGIVLLAGCTRAAPSAPEGAFATATAARIAGAPQSCVSTSPNHNLRVVDPMTLAYESGGTLYVNRLDAPCPGMRQLSTVMVEAHGTQYCQGDQVRGIEPQSIIPGPRCVLGPWTPYRMR